MLKKYLEMNNSNLNLFTDYSGLKKSTVLSMNKKSVGDWKIDQLNSLSKYLNKDITTIIDEINKLKINFDKNSSIKLGKFNIENRRYIGNKNKLIAWMMPLIFGNTEGESFFDVFAGTGIVSKNVLHNYKKIILNDFLYSNEIIYKAFFNGATFNEDKLQQLKEKYNNISPNKLEENYFSINYGNKYLSLNDSKKVGKIRDLIDANNSINDKERSILLSSLVYSVDKISNTVGHYDAFRTNNLPKDRFNFELINPLKTTDKIIEIFRSDANILSKKIRADITFIDPPYNSRQYSRFYHLLENLVKWDKPRLYGKAMKPPSENISSYSKVDAPESFENLIQSLNSKYIVVTYNNTYSPKSSSSKNKISHEQILHSLNSVGITKVFEKKHDFFNSGKTKFQDHKEFLFITKVEKEKA